MITDYIHHIILYNILYFIPNNSALGDVHHKLVKLAYNFHSLWWGGGGYNIVPQFIFMRCGSALLLFEIKHS